MQIKSPDEYGFLFHFFDGSPAFIRVFPCDDLNGPSPEIKSKFRWIRTNSITSIVPHLTLNDEDEAKQFRCLIATTPYGSFYPTLCHFKGDTFNKPLDYLLTRISQI